MIRPIRLLLAFLIAFPLAAQDEPARGQDAGSQGAPRDGDSKGGIRAVDVEVVEKAGTEGRDPETGAKGEFKLDKSQQIVSARGHCRFDGSVQPRRLLPGQSGRLMVTMMLEGDSVLTGASSLKVSAAEGGLTLGSWNLLPATVARIASAYKGQAVYDNWAVIEGTVTMPAEARMGERRHAVLHVEFDLHSGSNAELLGHFHETVNIPCEVGATANPVVSAMIPGSAAAAAKPSATAEPKAAEAPAVPAAPSASSTATQSPQAAELTDPVPPQTPPNAVEEPGPNAELAPSVEESTKDNLMIVGGGAAALILVIAIFLLRRR